MEFSENWLREWINPDINCEKLCEQLTELGIEVETVINLSKNNLYHGLLIGKILSFISHPNADNLNIITLQISNIKNIRIIYEKSFICYPNMKVVVAPIGSVLLDNKKIKIFNFKEYISEGKICLFSDLGIFYKNNSIIELPLDAPVGVNIKDYLFNDNIIKINIGPNRPDCFSIIGIAREISIKNNLKLSMMKDNVVIPTINDKISVLIKEPKICPRYFCRVIKNINPNINTPFWILEKLRRSNVTSVNIIIDVIHYIAIEIGVPLHVFNLDSIQGNIILRLSTLEDNIVLSNNILIKPNNNLFVISDDYKVLSVGGNFNTINTEINNSINNILIGSAFFNICIDHKENFFYEENSYIKDYYKRGIDFNKQEYAIEYATNILLNIIGGQAGPLSYQCNNDYFYISNIITIHRIKLNKIIGFEIDNTIIVDILTRLGYQIQEKDNFWEVIAPTWRFDINIEEDVIGDILRIYGYSNIPVIPLSSQEVINTYEYDIDYLMRIKNILINKGYYEVITYGFVNPNIQNILFPNISQLLLLNPISKEMSSMRMSLWTGLLTTLSYNQNRQQENICLFETGLCFFEDRKSNMGIRQDFLISGLANGRIYDKNWDHLDKTIDFYDLKGVVESILEIDGKMKDITFNRIDLFCLHPGKSASIFYKEKLIGYIGVLHPILKKKFKLINNTVMFEIIWNDNFFYDVPIIKNISCFPQSKRDLSIIVSEHILVGDILNLCINSISEKIEEVYLFDIYRDNKIGVGKKSIGIRFVFKDFKKTLAEDEINDIIKKCILNLKKYFQATLRDE